MVQIRGSVTEKWSRRPMSGVVISWNGGSVLTDGNGQFVAEVPSPYMMISAMHISHETVTQQASTGYIEIVMTPIAGALR